MKKYINIKKNLIYIPLLSIIILMLMYTSVILPENTNFGIFLLPIPIALMYIMQEKIIFNIIYTLSIVFTGFASNDFQMTILVAFIGITVGVLLGLLIKIKRGVGYSVLITSIYSLIVLVLGYLVYSNFFGGVSVTIVFEELKLGFNEVINQGYNKENNEILKKFFSDGMLISLGIILLIISNYTNYMLTKLMLKLIDNNSDEERKFNLYYISNLFGAVFIIIICISMVLDSRGSKIGNYLYTVSLSIFLSTLVVNGLATVNHILINKSKLSKILTGILMVVTFPFMMQGYVVIGLIEMIIDYRKLDPHRIFRKK